MNGEQIVAVSAAVVALVQLVKWSGLPDRFGPLAVMALSAMGVALWAWGAGIIDVRPIAFALFAGWIAVSTSAAGVFGFSRASASALAQLRPPPDDGAGSSKTVK